MIKELRDVEINLYMNESIFIYDLYKLNDRNYENTLEEINKNIDNMDKENFHNKLLEVIDIDNNTDEYIYMINDKYRIINSIDNYEYSKILIDIYREFINKRIDYKILQEIIKKSIIILVKSGNNYLNFIKFQEVKLDFNDINMIIDKDYKEEKCLICIENINIFKSFRIFSCCFSNICNDCYKLNNYRCPICNKESTTLISY